MNLTLDVVEQVRKYKSESQISMGAEIETLKITCTEQEKLAIQQFEDDLIGVTKAKKIQREEGNLAVNWLVIRKIGFNLALQHIFSLSKRTRLGFFILLCTVYG